MAEIKKYVIQGIVGLLFTSLTFWVASINEATKTNKDSSIEHTKDIQTLSGRIDNLENNYNKMPDIYVTRRELELKLQNIDEKVGNIGNDVKDINNKFDKMLEKIYEK